MGFLESNLVYQLFQEAQKLKTFLLNKTKLSSFLLLNFCHWNIPPKLGNSLEARTLSQVHWGPLHTLEIKSLWPSLDLSHKHHVLIRIFELKIVSTLMGVCVCPKNMGNSSKGNWWENVLGS